MNEIYPIMKRGKMKKVTILICLLVLILIPYPKSVNAQFASDVNWASSITYYTNSATSGQLFVNYYLGATVYTAGPYTLNPHQAGSINIGSTSVPDGFAGAAVLSSSVPVFATYVQFEKVNPTAYSRAFYTGFDPSKAGPKFYLATTRANGVTETTVAVQNLESFEITATLDFYAVGAVAPTFTKIVDILPNATFISKLPDISTYPGGSFDGSAVITATKKGDSATPGNIVATAQETQDAGYGVYAFEGTKEGATSVFLPSAMCDYFGQTSFYAIQNAGDGDALVTVDYYNTSGVKVGSLPETVVPKGAKLSTNPCAASLLVGAVGSAVVKSNNGIPLIAIGKISSTGGLITAFSGALEGATTVVAPYVRWAADQTTSWSAYLSVMNVGTAPATNITAKYYDASGTLRATHVLASAGTPLAAYTKVNTNPNTAGALIGGSFGYPADGGANGGAVEITSDQPIVVLVRLATTPTIVPGVTIFGEDYIALPAVP